MVGVGSGEWTQTKEKESRARESQARERSITRELYRGGVDYGPQGAAGEGEESYPATRCGERGAAATGE